MTERERDRAEKKRTLYIQQCPKCGNNEYTLEWHIHNINHTTISENIEGRACLPFSTFQFSGEHLHVTCSECSYEWKETPLDSLD
jgi:predicted nucleic-acid-binding Zn-ribbon protein